MKNILILIVVGVILGSCEDQLDQAPLSDKGSNGFYQNETDFEQAVNGIYERLDPYPNRVFYLSEIRSDNVFGASQGGVRPWDPVNNFARTLASSDVIRDAWNENYNAIMAANTVLDKLDAIVVPDDAVRARLEGEAKFLRGFFYFDLVRLYGGVPVINTIVTPVQSLEIPRATVPEVYTQIISDLQDAISLLPETYDDASDLGRATKDAARGILARVHLTRSGPDYGIAGPGLGVDEFQEALDLLSDIETGGRHAMETNYADIFSYDHELEDGNTEIIFDIQYISGGLGLGGQWPGEFVPEAYPNTFGAGFSGGLDTKHISQDFIQNMDTANDLRWDFSVQQGWTDLSGSFVPNNFYRKFMDESKLGTVVLDRFDYGINYPILRYTDVLMMKAEAILQGASGTQGEVDQIVNDVRDRANLGPLTNVTLDDLLAERRREFAAEGLRWHDLVRTGRVLTVMNAWLPPAEDGANVMATSIDANMILYPIHQSQLDVKPGLYTQNLGY